MNAIHILSRGIRNDQFRPIADQSQRPTQVTEIGDLVESDFPVPFFQAEEHHDDCYTVKLKRGFGSLKQQRDSGIPRTANTVLLVLFSDTVKGPMHQMYFVVLLTDRMVVVPRVESGCKGCSQSSGICGPERGRCVSPPELPLVVEQATKSSFRSRARLNSGAV
jgi:hypothetical protein